MIFNHNYLTRQAKLEKTQRPPRETNIQTLANGRNKKENDDDHDNGNSGDEDNKVEDDGDGDKSESLSEASIQKPANKSLKGTSKADR